MGRERWYRRMETKRVQKGAGGVATLVYLNGEFVPYERAVIPVEDRGNLFADGVYEVIRFYGGRPLAMEAHMERLRRSAEAIRLPAPDVEALTRAGLELVKANGVVDGSLYLQVSRGVAPRNHLFPPGAKPTVFMIAREVPRPDRQVVEKGVACITVPDIRWGRCDIKSIGLLPNVLAKQEAHEKGAYEALFVRDGIVTEGTSSNLFAVKGGKLLTHPEGEHILPGITRRIILHLAEREGVEVELAELREEELREADELFISGTLAELMPVTSVDGRPVGSGSVGPVTRRLRAQYDALVERVRAGSAERF